VLEHLGSVLVVAFSIAIEQHPSLQSAKSASSSRLRVCSANSRTSIDYVDSVWQGQWYLR
jgi:hypothetical protein